MKDPKKYPINQKKNIWNKIQKCTPKISRQFVSLCLSFSDCLLRTLTEKSENLLPKLPSPFRLPCSGNSRNSFPKSGDFRIKLAPEIYF